jgi:hypothetical protein
MRQRQAAANIWRKRRQRHRAPALPPRSTGGEAACGASTLRKAYHLRTGNRDIANRPNAHPWRADQADLTFYSSPDTLKYPEWWSSAGGDAGT